MVNIKIYELLIVHIILVCKLLLITTELNIVFDNTLREELTVFESLFHKKEPIIIDRIKLLRYGFGNFV